MGEDDLTVVTLANRCYLYQLLKTVFGSEPSKELVGVVVGEPTRISLTFAVGSDSPNPSAGAVQSFYFLDELATHLDSDPEATLSDVRDEYTRLLIGPDPLPAPPWESVYTTKERLLFVKDTLEVRRAYLAQGFLPKGYPNEADDHISLEFDFLFHLADETRAALDEGDVQKRRVLLLAQQEFLQQHLLRWIGTFATDIQASKTKLLYPQMAQLAARIVADDAATVDRLLGSA